MDKWKELADAKAAVARLEREVAAENKNSVEAIAGQITNLFESLEVLYCQGARDIKVRVGSDDLIYNGYEWSPSYDSRWYSSSMEC